MSPQHRSYVRLLQVMESGARCLGSAVGAVLVEGDRALADSRLLGIGCNGTPDAVTNCDEGGCQRCLRRETRVSGRYYDICLCVHAEQNALATAARFGVPTAGATLFTSMQPCFTCLKELMQARIAQIYFLDWWPGAVHPDYVWMLPQYEALLTAFRAAGCGFVRLVLSDADAGRRRAAHESRRAHLAAARSRLVAS